MEKLRRQSAEELLAQGLPTDHIAYTDRYAFPHGFKVLYLNRNKNWTKAKVLFSNINYSNKLYYTIENARNKRLSVGSKNVIPDIKIGTPWGKDSDFIVEEVTAKELILKKDGELFAEPIV